ncbi:hypothetical protein [Arthrobacter sp. KK5.5]|uniref:hypothetical protein n=1 Tax=Arthrobacter sp. KK5.5 TaxID=3373084 RepID=UPI003EE6EBB3
MEHQIPKQLRATTKRQPFPPKGYKELRVLSLEDRQRSRQAELDRLTGRVDLDVPPTPGGRLPPRQQRLPLAPATDAIGGNVEVVRAAWVAKYNPTRAQQEAHLPVADPSVLASDVWQDFEWADPLEAIRDPWINSQLMRGSKEELEKANPGDLVFVMRTEHLDQDVHQLARRTVVGLWWIESIKTGTYDDGNGNAREYVEAAGFPIRRFDFPVPVVETGQMDADFERIAALRDRRRRAFIELSPAEALHMARACGLPASVLSETDHHRLAPLCARLKLGPPWEVEKRIRDGAKAVDHRNKVEANARNTAVKALRRERFAVVSTEDERGANGPGADLWGRSYEVDGSVSEVRVEVKGTGTSNPWGVSLTHHERRAAEEDLNVGQWWMLIVTHARRPDRKEHWLTSEEAVRKFSIKDQQGRWVADSSVTLWSRAQGSSAASWSADRMAQSTPPS